MNSVLIDNLEPNRPVLVNLDHVDCINWKDGTLTFEFTDNKCVEYECEKAEFIDLISRPNFTIVKEFE